MKSGKRVTGLTYQYPFISSAGVKYIPTISNTAMIPKAQSKCL